MSLALPEGHGLVTGKGVMPKELDGLPLMTYSTAEAGYFHGQVMRLYDSAGTHPNVTQVPALLAFVAAGLGVTPVPASATAVARLLELILDQDRRD
jgi:DNA-binding transcriptional LysR family regulator